MLRTRYADRDGYAVNGRLGARVDVTQALAVRAAAYSGFRVPTLNELYRPFRVGNDVTEANAELEPERLLGGEAALDWRPWKSVRVIGTAFFNRLEDAVGNVTIGAGPGTFEPGGFIPAGGVLRQRRNIDVVFAPGFDFTTEWRVTPRLLLKGTYLFTQPTIRRADDPELVGNLLAQTPQHSISASAEWKPTAKWTITTQTRFTDRQFEDDQNSRELAPFTTVDAAVFYDFSSTLSAGVQVENLFNAEIETGKSATGVVSIGAPRLVTLQLRCSL
jgi:outer membrane receptor protein involved in Fe transport